MRGVLRSPWQRVALAMFAVGWGANQFSPMLVVYRDELGLSAQTRALLFGVYAAGLIPGLLLGGAASDRRGRRSIVVPFVALSPVASLLLVLLREDTLGLGAGRLLAGVCSGVVFGAATAWLRELLAAEAPGVAARRAAVALTMGFGVGPLVASMLAEWAPDPLWIPYLPHIALGVAASVVLLAAPEPDVTRAADGPLLSIPRVCRTPRFVGTVVLVAPWVFACPSIAFALLPGEIGGAGGSAVLFAGVAAAMTLGTAVLVQPAARRLEDRRALAAGAAGLIGTAAGVAVGVCALAADSRVLILVGAPLFGVGYGGCLISGLRETERIADPAELGATVSVFYALTYTGFATPYLVGLVNGPLGEQGALAAVAGVALLCLAVSVLAGRREPHAVI